MNKLPDRDNRDYDNHVTKSEANKLTHQSSKVKWLTILCGALVALLLIACVWLVVITIKFDQYKKANNYEEPKTEQKIEIEQITN